MSKELDELIRQTKAWYAANGTPEEQRWVDLYVQMDQLMSQIIAAPIVANDPMAQRILEDFGRCDSMEMIARQVDILAEHVETLTRAKREREGKTVPKLEKAGYRTTVHGITGSDTLTETNPAGKTPRTVMKL
jgi:hypothetical protein